MLYEQIRRMDGTISIQQGAIDTRNAPVYTSISACGVATLNMFGDTE